MKRRCHQVASWRHVSELVPPLLLLLLLGAVSGLGGSPAPAPANGSPMRALNEANRTLELSAPAERVITGARDDKGGLTWAVEQMTMNDVACNSRCNCVQLKFARPDKKPLEGSEGARGGGEEGLGAAAHLNRLALIEFGQDYSFDEPDGQEDEPGMTADERPAPDAADQAEEPQTGSAVGQLLWPGLAGSGASAASGGGGDRATIKLAAGADDRSSAANSSSSGKRQPGFSLAGSARNRSALGRPLNGHALLLPPFKQLPQQAPAGAEPADQLFLSLHQYQQSLRAPAQAQARDPPAPEGRGQPQEPQLELMRPLERLDQLAQRQLGDLSRLPAPNASRELELVHLITRSLVELDRRASEPLALVLRNNNLKFELWTQMYALLMVQMRTNVYQLDLSRNALVKLGVTFTGYIEHHLVYQLLKSNFSDQSWPFSASAGATASRPTSDWSELEAANASGAAASSLLKLASQFKLAGAAGPGKAGKRLLRRPLLGDGRLYNAVRLTLPLGAANWSRTGEPASGGQKQQQQHLIQMILHQPAQIRALDLSRNKLKWLINDQFRILKHVQAIRLDHNKIRFIHQEAFDGLHELKYLNLNFNRLQTIYMEQFQTNYKLLAIFMRANYLSYLRAGSLASQTGLKRLDLSRNKLTILSSNAFVGLDSLEHLNLSSNSLVHVPSGSFHPLLVSLRQLDLSDNQLAQLMPGAFFHLQLEQIHLDDNDQLVSIERGAFWDLPRLAFLSLRSNSQLASVNAQAFVGVPKLSTIQLDECPLLDAQTRQMLANLTAANTMRAILRQQQQQQQLEQAATTGSPTAIGQTNGTTALANGGQPPLPTTAAPIAATQTNTTSATTPTAASVPQLRHRKPAPEPNFSEPQGYSSQYEQQMSIQLQRDQTSATNKITKYFYSLAGLLLVLAALKLVLRFNSTRHNLESWRRRRRVYQTGSADGDASNGDNTDNELHAGAQKELTSAASIDSLASTPASSVSSAPSPEAGGSFALLERPQNVIKRAILSGELAGQTDANHPACESATPAEPADAGHQLAAESEAELAATCACCCADCSDGQLVQQLHAQLHCCDQLALAQEPQGHDEPRPYDADGLLHELASHALGRCELEQANCSHCCYQTASSS